MVSDGRISRKDANRAGIITGIVLNQSVRKQPRTMLLRKGRVLISAGTEKSQVSRFGVSSVQVTGTLEIHACHSVCR